MNTLSFSCLLLAITSDQMRFSIMTKSTIPVLHHAWTAKLRATPFGGETSCQILLYTKKIPVITNCTTMTAVVLTFPYFICVAARIPHKKN